MALRRATEQCRAGQNLSLQEAEGLVAGLADFEVGAEVKVEFLLAWGRRGGSWRGWRGLFWRGQRRRG